MSKSDFDLLEQIMKMMTTKSENELAKGDFDLLKQKVKINRAKSDSDSAKSDSESTRSEWSKT